MPPDRAAPLWYFGYGSNVERATFLGRRRMRPVESRPGVLEGWRLRFDLPVGPGERGVANLTREPGARVWGVLWCITPADAQHLDRTEGVHRGFYLREPVEVRDAGGRATHAFAYRSDRGRSGRKPSRRYLGLLLRGAREHGLPAEWIAELRGLELAVDEREAAQGRLF